MSRVRLLYLIVFIVYINAGANLYIRLPCSSASQLLITMYRLYYQTLLHIIVSIDLNWILDLLDLEEQQGARSEWKIWPILIFDRKMLGNTVSEKQNELGSWCTWSWPAQCVSRHVHRALHLPPRSCAREFCIKERIDTFITGRKSSLSELAPLVVDRINNIRL